MAEVLTAGQMQCIEQTAMASDSVTGAELMERAGQGVVDAVLKRWPELATLPSPKAVVLCGPGNNGGDGFVIARLLKQHGWQVQVYLFGSSDTLPVDAAKNHDRWCGLGPVGTQVATSREMLESQVSDCLFVDALFGTGLTRALPGPLAAFLAEVCGDASVRTVAVDIPSGLCADSGRMLRAAGGAPSAPAQFDLTVTFHCAKRGHLTQEGALASGALAIVDIGLGDAHMEVSQTLTRETQHATLGRIAHWIGLEDRALAALATKSPTGYKFSHGHAVVFAGGSYKTGAARLAARGALRVGAGLVTLAVPDAALGEVAAQVTAIMITPVNDPDEAAAMLQDSRLNAVCLGPGLGLDRARALVPVALDQIGSGRRAAVLDADALTGFADAPNDLFALLHRDCVLTPHFGEFSRLFPDLADKLLAEPTQGPAYSRYDAVRSAAARAGCTVLLKGPDTIIGYPDGRLSVNASLYQEYAPWLATAGSGDVLAGYITGLLARGVPAMQAAELGAWLHAQCGRCFGPGLIAEDLPEQLPKVFQDLLG